MKLTIEDGRDSFYTFDTNRILLLTATDEEQINQVEFSTEENGETVSWTSDVLTGEDGIKYVQVPNEFLNGNYSRLVCYGVALDSKGEFTRQKEVFRIRARQEPEDYFLTYSERVTFASIKALTEQYKATTKQYMDTTEGFKDNAGRSAELANKYAENNEDVAVEPGKYSAKHWSIKAEAAKETAVQKATEAGTSEVNSKTYMESAQSAKQDAETAKNAANTILEQVQSKGTEITNFVATSKTEIETQKNESVNAVKSVYQTDLDELKGDLSNKIDDVRTANEYNLFNDELLLTTGISQSGLHTYAGVASEFHKAFSTNAIPVSGEANTQYKLKLKAKTTADSGTTGNGLNFLFVYSDNTTSSAFNISNATTDFTEFVGYSSMNKTLIGVRITYGSLPENVWTVSEVQVCDPNTADYAPYYTADDNNAKKRLTLLENKSAYLDKINQAICGVLSPTWIPCDMDITVNGWTYYDKVVGANAKRIAITETSVLKLREGDVIGLSDYTDARYYLGWRINGTYYTSGGWLTTDFTVTQDGEYVMLVSHLDNRLIDSVEELSSLFKYSVSSILDDVEEIKEDAQSVPKYWKSALQTAFQTIRSNATAMGSHIAQFFFVTDTHWENNAQNSGKLLNWLCYKTEINTVVFGGDAYNGEKDSIQNALDIFWTFYDAYNESNIDLFSTVGNHDNNAPREDSSLLLNDEQVYSVMHRREEESAKLFNTGNVAYIDNENQKVRIILFKTVWELSESTYAKVAELVNELSSDWTVVLCSHMYWDILDSDNLPVARQPMISAGEQLATLKVNASAEIACWIVGHVHKDCDTVINGLQVIGVTTDCYRQNHNATTMTLNTNTEQAFDCFQIDTLNKVIKTTRIGAGSDREWSY